MKKLIQTISFATLVSAALLQSCKKEEKNEDHDGPKSVQEVMDNFAPDMQTFTIDPSINNTITGKDGTKITIPANALVDAQGNTVNAPVTISLKEILSLEDQITSNIAAISNEKALKSGGEFFFEAKANGQKLNVALNSEISVDIPTNNVDSTMNVFIGENLEPNDSVNGEVNWVKADSAFVNKDSAQNVVEVDYKLLFGVDKYVMKINDLYNTSWYNVDHYINWNNLSWTKNCKVKCNGNSSNEKIVFQIKLVYKQYGYAGWFGMNNYMQTNEWSGIVQEEWAVGEVADVIVVGVGTESGKIYYGRLNFTIDANNIAEITMNPISAAELEGELKSL